MHDATKDMPEGCVLRRPKRQGVRSTGTVPLLPPHQVMVNDETGDDFKVPPLDLSCLSGGDGKNNNAVDYQEPPLSRLPTANVRRKFNRPINENTSDLSPAHTFLTSWFALNEAPVEHAVTLVSSQVEELKLPKEIAYCDEISAVGVEQALEWYYFPKKTHGSRFLDRENLNGGQCQ